MGLVGSGNVSEATKYFNPYQQQQQKSVQYSVGCRGRNRFFFLYAAATENGRNMRAAAAAASDAAKGSMG